MKTSSKRLLSAFLAMVMVMSMLVIPAAAVTAKKWDFLNDGTAEGFTGDAFAGVTVGGEFQSGYGAKLANGQTIVFPVDGACDIKVHVKHKWKIWINNDQANTEEYTAGGGDEVVTFHYAGEAGNVTLNTGTMSWVADIELAGYTAPVASLELNMNTVTVKVGEDAATVNATVKNGAATAWEATSNDTSVATAAAASGTVTITPVAEGTATVTVKATVDGVDTPLTADIAVTVDPAGAYTSWDFTGPDFQASAPASYKGLTISGGKAGGATYGVAFFSADNASIAIPVDGPCTIAVTTSYNWDVQLGDDETTRDTAQGDGSAPKIVEFSYTGGAGTATVKALNGRTWIKSIELKYPTPLVPSADKRIQVWDFGGKVEADTDLYTNHITPETLKNAKLTDGNPLIDGGIIKQPQNTGVAFGDLIFTAGNNDKFFSNIADLAEKAGGNAGNTHVHDFGDGYTSAGGFITNGGGNADRRHVTVKGVKAGETVTVYLSNNQSETTYEVENHIEIPKVTVASKQFGTMSFVATKDGDYKIWANGGKPGFLRVAVIPPVTVNGSITLPADFNATGWGLKFVDPDTKAVTTANVNNDGTYTVELAPGHSYNASLTNANGWGMTTATKSVTPAKDNITTGKTHNLTVEAKSQYTYSGAITGFAADYDVSKLAITLIPDEDSRANAGAEDVNLGIDKSGMTFTAVLDPSVVYTLELKGVNDYAVKTPDEVTSEGDNLTGQSITVEAKALVAAAGKFVTLDVDDQFAPLKADSVYAPLTAQVTGLVFENVDDGYTYTATVADGGYTVNLRAGAYLAKATVNGYATKTHVVVADKAVTKDLLFVSTATPAAVGYAADVYVGDASKSPNFKTVTGAMAYIKRMTRTDAQRVTVHIAPGTYREQISIDSKNVTFVNDAPGKEVKLTWYYGIGYTYYSASGASDTESWYDAEKAFDRYIQPVMNVARWGCTVRVRAPGFQAENITFENSFNYYMTDEELVDGVAPNGKESIRFAREYGADVTSKAATERAAALWVDTNNGRGDMTEFKNCKFLSSQDTLGTGKRMYFKDCYIEGMTDYICGPGEAVFDTCQLNWKGYSETAAGGYVTAPQTGAGEKGYLFRSCYVSGDTKLMLAPGQLGRTWGAENTKCIFLNTTLQSANMITEPTWGEMQGFKPANSSTLLEWGTMLADGTKVDLSKRQLQNTVPATQPTAKPTDFFAGWVPEYYAEEAATVAFETDPYITDNGDINIPYPGHTLTVNYSLGQANDANDVSVIQWYRVKDGAETLVKTSSAVAGKTYQIQVEDVGAQIKVTVTPTTLSGKIGEAKSMTVAESVKDGYDDPSNPVDPELGDGVNIFLAGDSTVKHYGAVGMHQSGKIGKEGSWGEFLQDYFDGSKATVVNYANGGRSTRNFINEGMLDKIAENIKEGDYLFIQFGHNDCADGASYIDDRYAPLGTPDQSGVYPSTPGVKNAEGKYTWDCGGTYKWYLQQYINAAKAKGAIPVLITPVARMYYNADGTIRPHHDDSKTQNNAYCAAVKQLAQEQDVLLIDGYALTEKMYVDAYKAGGNDTYGQQVMAVGDKTHSNKLGGMVEAALIAQAIQGMDLNISKTIKAPSQVLGKTEKGQTAFMVDGKGKFTAYDMLQDYAETAPYWMGEGQKLLDAIAAKAEELNGGSPDDPSKPVDKTALNKAVADAKKALAAATVAENGSEIAANKTWVTAADKEVLEAAIAVAEALGDDATATQVKNALTAVNDAVKAIKAGEKTSGGGTTNRPSGSSGTSVATTPVTTTATNPDGTVAITTTDKDGNVDITVKGEDGEILVEVSIPGVVAAPETEFVDVPEEHWAAKSINNMASLGVVKGVSDNTYDMASPMTRGTIATVFYRLSNGKGGKTATFTDVTAEAWYADAVGWAASIGVVNGYNQTTFGPEDTITRQQLAVMIARYARLLGLDTTAEQIALDTFTDGFTAENWATDSLAWCVKTGVMKGRGGDVLDPTADVTRAEAAVMVDRMIGLIK